MFQNFIMGVQALAQDIYLTLSRIIFLKSVVGFFFGFIVTLLISAFIITKNPKKIPIILQYSKTESFEKISEKNEEGTYKVSFSKFAKIYLLTRAIFFCTLTSFFLLIIFILITQRYS